MTGIKVLGYDFVESPTGKIFKMVGVSDFCLFTKYIKGMPIDARLAEWKQIAKEGGYSGPITLRVFRHAATWNAFALNPNEYPLSEYKDKLRKFISYLGSQGFYVELTGGDAQVIWPTDDPIEADWKKLQAHLYEVSAAIVDLPNVFLEVLNQRWKNGRAYQAVPPKWGLINPLLRSSGAYGEVHNWPDGSNLDYINYHGTREVDAVRWPKWVHDLPVQASVLNTVHNTAAVLNEPFRAEESVSDPQWFSRMGLTVTYCAGITFHSQQGRDGQVLIGNQRLCAIYFFKGVAAGMQLV